MIFWSSLPLKQKFHQITTVNKMGFELNLAKKTNFTSFNDQQKQLEKDPYFLPKSEKNASVKFLKSFLQTDKRVPGLKIKSGIPEALTFQAKSSQLCTHSFAYQHICIYYVLNPTSLCLIKQHSFIDSLIHSYHKYKYTKVVYYILTEAWKLTF